MDKSVLEQLLSSYNWWMGLSTVAVAIGILGEYVAHFVFEREARRNRLEMAVSILFGVLVLGGVVGEYIFGSKLSEVSGQLQRIADTEVAQSNKDAAAARGEAETARKEADSFELKIAKANKDAADALERAAKAEENLGNARRDAAAANERAANGEKEAARLSKAAEDERLARVKIEQRLADRKLTDAQVEAVAAKLRPFAGQEFDVTPYWDLKESLAIANRILGALNLAGWKYTPPEKSGFMLGGIAGVLVYVHPAATEKVKKAADSLVSALSEQGIGSEIRQQNPANSIDNKLHLNVGAKP